MSGYAWALSTEATNRQKNTSLSKPAPTIIPILLQKQKENTHMATQTKPDIDPGLLKKFIHSFAIEVARDAEPLQGRGGSGHKCVYSHTIASEDGMYYYDVLRTVFKDLQLVSYFVQSYGRCVYFHTNMNHMYVAEAGSSPIEEIIDMFRLREWSSKQCDIHFNAYLAWEEKASSMRHVTDADMEDLGFNIAQDLGAVRIYESRRSPKTEVAIVIQPGATREQIPNEPVLLNGVPISIGQQILRGNRVFYRLHLRIREERYISIFNNPYSGCQCTRCMYLS